MVSPVGPSAPPGPLTLTFSLAGQMLAQVPRFSTHLVTSQPGPQAPQHQPSGPRPTPHLSPGVWSLRPSHFYASCLPGQAGLRSRKNGAFLYMLHIIRSAPPPEGCHMMGVCPGIHQRAPWVPLLPPGGVPGTQGHPASRPQLRAQPTFPFLLTATAASPVFCQPAPSQALAPGACVGCPLDLPERQTPPPGGLQFLRPARAALLRSVFGLWPSTPTSC